MDIGDMLRRAAIESLKVKQALQAEGEKWDVRSGYKLIINPSVRCPWCNRMVPTGKVWWIDTTPDRQRIMKMWEAGTGRATHPDVAHPHAHKNSWGICMGNATEVEDALIWGLNPGSEYNYTSQWLRGMGHWCDGVKRHLRSIGDTAEMPVGYDPEAHPLSSFEHPIPPPYVHQEDKWADDDEKWYCYGCEKWGHQKNMEFCRMRFMWLCPRCKEAQYQECGLCKKTTFEPYGQGYVSVRSPEKPSESIHYRTCSDCRDLYKICIDCSNHMLKTEARLHNRCDICYEENKKRLREAVVCTKACRGNHSYSTMVQCQACGRVQTWNNMDGHRCWSCYERRTPLRAQFQWTPTEEEQANGHNESRFILGEDDPDPEGEIPTFVNPTVVSEENENVDYEDDEDSYIEPEDDEDMESESDEDDDNDSPL